MHIYIERWQVVVIICVFISWKLIDIVGILLAHFLPPS